MTIQINYLGWDQPALVSAVQHLANRFEREGFLELGEVIVVVPGRRAGQRLMELLLAHAREQQLGFRPPQLVTGGQLPELLYDPPAPQASEVTERLAWGRAWQETPPEIARQVSPRLPQAEAIDQWQQLAEVLRTLHVDLGAEGLRFADVVRDGNLPARSGERERWQALATIAGRYEALLEESDRADRQLARLEAIQHRACRTDRPIVLVGMAELNRVQRQMLAQVADHVSALVVAPASYADRFDEFGSLVSTAWQEAPLEILDEQIRLAHDAADQANEVVRTLAELNGRYAAEEITIGVPDAHSVASILRQLEEHGHHGRWFVGKPLVETRPFQLIVALENYLSRDGASEFAALVRHPDVAEWLKQVGLADQWLAQLDDYVARHLPVRFGDRWLGDDENNDQVRRAHAAVTRLLHDLSGESRLPCDQWSEKLADVLAEIYSANESQPADPDLHTTTEACKQLADVLDQVASVPARVMPQVTSSEAIGLVRQQLARGNIAAAPDPAAIQLFGWLELPLDDAPCLVVTSLNERFVPESICGALFLPDSLRRQLDLNDNRRRYARDAYALDVLLHTRRELRLIVSRADSEQNALAPSRLLFATDGKTVARRVLRLFDTADRTRPPVRGRFDSNRRDSDYAIPPPGGDWVQKLGLREAPLDTLRVTAFKEYLACPYRFYLRNVARLGDQDFAAVELDPLQFGNLIHGVLNDFGRSDLRGSTDAEQIREFLEHELNAHAHGWFGERRRPAVGVQIGQARQRLAAFARWQAQWAAEGWEIKHVEVPDDRHATTRFDVDGEPFSLAGRIDRVDQHPDGRTVIFDYKTSAAGQSPEKTHRTKGEWIDLQLPLYRHIASSLNLKGPFQFGYIVLPDDTSSTGERLADWTSADLDAADEQAREVIRQVRRSQFWPPAEMANSRFDAFADICLEGVFERPLH